MIDVFLSYRRETGVECCSVLNRSLEEDGYKVFFDLNSLRQGNFDKQIEQAINECSFVLVVLAPHDLDRCFFDTGEDWIIHELDLAIKHKKPVIPVSFKTGFVFPEECDKIPALKYLSKQEICDISGPGFADLIKSKLYGFMDQTPAKQMREEYQAGIRNPEYLAWEIESLRTIYSDFTFVYECGRYYPSTIFEGSPDVAYPFKSMTELSYLQPLTTPIDYKNLPHYYEYNKIIGKDIHFPDLYGFANVGLLFDDNGRVSGLKAEPRTYNETVYTSHVLHYELWKAYKALNGSRLATLDDLPLRKRYHKNKTNKEVVYSGYGRSALSVVCLAIMAYDIEEDTYQIATARRSSNVAVYPGYMNIVPSGGFELYELENKQSSSVIHKNFSFVSALFREYIEEIFGDENFDHPTGDDDIKRLYRNDKIKEFRDKIGKTFFFEFLGVSYDMISLRPVFAFVLKIDDERYLYDNNIKSNSENTSISFISLCDFDEVVKEYAKTSPLMAQSAGVYTLLKRNHLYDDAINNKKSS